MNTETQSAGARLQRIKTVSRSVRYVVLGCLPLAIGNWLYYFITPSAWTMVDLSYPLMKVSLTVVLCLWYWRLGKLFYFYEHGLIFAAETIRCIKALGLLCVINSMLYCVFNMFSTLHTVWLNRYPPSAPPAPALPSGGAAHSAKIVESSLHMGFFSFSWGPINVGMMLVGAVIILIAWIMDEGRKIQEEQELTV